MRRLVSVLAVGILLAIEVVWAQETPNVIRKNDVLYGLQDGSGLLADIAYPCAGDRFPAIVIVHGGRWRTGSKNSTTWSVPGLKWASSP
ncbi:MAG: hypothetical protein ABSB35_01350 [Bryobacteraceae bacterium]|jgi:acetyl esterase/lipase